MNIRRHPTSGRHGLGIASAILFSLSGIGMPASAQPLVDAACGDLKSAYGPYDYTDPTHFREKLPIVEQYHFQPVVEQLKSGQRGREDPMIDIAYVLRSFPNHHRALNAMMRYQLKLERPPAPGTVGSADCWFARALKFRPDDPMVLTLYGIFLHRSDRRDESLDRYQQALELAPDSAELHYNVGLLYFDMADYDSSRIHANRAYELGYPLPGLRSKLERLSAGSRDN